MIEFEEMQKLWNAQKGETMYAINESALHNIVAKKKDAASRRINNVEIAISVINGLTTIFLCVITFIHSHFLNYINTVILIATIVYIQYFRRKRKKAENTFDRSMLGELDHAIWNANSMIRFNYLMIVGYILPMAAVTISVLIISGADLIKCLLVAGAFLLSILVLRWEQSAYNVPSKKLLLKLKKKLTEE